jgi:tRNA-2-methylthio-N6-dimethylallyladenosine synthase
LSAPKRFFLRTYGCQMNVHDSEKVANLLYHAGYVACDRADEADVLIVNTCSIRDKAERRLYSDLGVLRTWKAAARGRVLGVLGCVAQQEGEAIQRRHPHVDFVLGTHNLRLVPDALEAAQRGMQSTALEESVSLERFDLPERHPDYGGATPGRGYLTVMEGCDMFCSFCVVPRTRGREISRPAAAIVAEAESLARRGVRELLLLGQTVNAYGRHDLRRERAAQAGTMSFAALLRRLAEIPGIARLRYTSPHPLFFDGDLIRAHGDLPALCPHVHLPVQSGSDALLARMRRRYTSGDYRALVEALRKARPDIAITTDLIVGFPGESDADFRDTLNLVRDLGFVDAFSFKFSARPGTAAASLEGAVPGDVAQARLEELQSLQGALTFAAHRARVGETTEILVEGDSRRGGGQKSGRDPYHRVVNFDVPGGSPPRPGALVRVRIAQATPHSLIGVCPPGETPGRIRRSVKDCAQPADEKGRSALFGG